MATVSLSFTALPAHVRTARLVAAAVARRSGVDEAVLDEVRLAVGEACSRAVDLHRRHCPDEPVRVVLSEDPGAFRVRVSDRAPAAAEPEDPLAVLAAATARSAGGGSAPADDDADALPSGVGIAVISSLVEDVSVEPGPVGTDVRMSWPVATAASV